MNISKAAQLANLPVKTVRYYADIGLVTPCARTDSGYRVYDDNSVRQLVFIRRTRAFGFSIVQCRELLSLYIDNHRASAEVKKIASQRLMQIKEKQQELQILHDELDQLVNLCNGDNQPDCPILQSLQYG